MKNFRKIASLLLVLVMALALGTAALATQEGTLTGGSITIDNAVVGQTYNVYQILYIESYNKDSGAYAYKANSAWKSFVESEAIKDVYLSTDDQGYVTWVKTLTCKNKEEGHAHTDDCYTLADAAAFAKLAQVEAAKMTADATATATTTTVSFTNLKLGYYLVDSTLGTLCSLDTTNPSVIIKEKNGVPTNEKEVKEDSTETFGKTNDADIGQTVNFQSTITAQAGAENYVFHDKMSEGLTYGNVTSIKLNNTDVDAKYYTVKTEEPAEEEGGDTTALSDGCTFEVVFTQDFCDTLKANDKIIISYTATVNENANVGVPGNANDSWLDYGDKNNTKSTPKSETITYTWDVDVLKYANGDESKVLKDAEFVLLSSDKKQVATVVNGKLTGWADVPANENEANKTEETEWPANTVLTTDGNGKIEIDGLDADTYYLREVKAPAGYNKLAEDVKVEITGATKGEGDTLSYTTVVAKVNNQSGTELPSTGGMGTKILYAIGALLVIGAGVLLVTKKRMNRSENA